MAYTPTQLFAHRREIPNLEKFNVYAIYPYARTMTDLRIETVSINSLTLDPSNARKHDTKNLKAIASSLQKFMNVIAGSYKELDKSLYITTSHPALIYSLNRSENWSMRRKPTNASKVGKTSTAKAFANTNSNSRLTASFKYAGDTNKILCEMIG